MHFKKKYLLKYIRENNITIDKFCKIYDIKKINIFVLFNDAIEWSNPLKMESFIFVLPKIAKILNIELYKLIKWDI